MNWLSLTRYACGVVLCVWCLAAQAEPRSRLIADYEAFLASMAADIEKIVEAEFREREEDLKLLAQPFKMLTQVKVREQKGRNRVNVVSGTLIEVNIGTEPAFVRIGDRRVYYKDILPVDQQRLYWATQPDPGPLVLKVEQMRQEIEAQKERLRTVERNKRLEEAGYTKEWFAQMVRLNGEFRSRKELGDHTVTVEVYIPDALPVARVRLRNETDQPSAFVAFFKQKRVGTNAPLGSSTEVPDKVWAASEFWLDKQDVAGDDVVAKFTDRRDSLRLLMLRTKVGQWVLLPELHPDHRPLVNTVNTQVCPECFGSGKVAGDGVPVAAPIPALEAPATAATPTAAAPAEGATPTAAATAAATAADEEAIADAVAQSTGQATATTMVCGTCLGKGTMMTEAPVKERVYFFRMMLAPSGMADYNAQVAETFGRQAFGTKPYQSQVTKLIEDIQAKARAYRQENEAKLREEQERRRQQEEERRRQIENQARIEQRYDWRSPEQLRKEPMDKPYRASLNLRLDELLYPSKMWDEKDAELRVEKMTVFMSPRNGVELQSKERYKIFAMLYRVLKAVTDDGTPRYYLQYLLEVDNSYASDAKKMQVEIEFTDKNEPPTTFKLPYTTTLRPTWNGHVGALVPLTADQVMGGLSDAKVEWAQPPPPKPGEEAPKAGTEAPKAEPAKGEEPLFP
jgi:hypothetical protein